MIDLLKQLCRQNGVSGDEDAIRAFIREQAAPYADSIRTDALGNLIVCKKGRPVRRVKAAAVCPHGRGGLDRHPGHRRGLLQV